MHSASLCAPKNSKTHSKPQLLVSGVSMVLLLVAARVADTPTLPITKDQS
jgi:hypothetical protein